ncbi:MAG: methyltransferase domain-containing protein [Thermococcus sp.]
MTTFKDISMQEGARHSWGILLMKPELLKNFLEGLFRVKKHLDIIEVGCYKGMLVGWLHQNFPRPPFSWNYVGVDIIEPPDRRRDYPHYIMNAEALEFPANSFDVYIAIEVIEHIPDYTRALREAYRVLRPGGGFFMQSVMCSNPSALADRTHFHVLHPETFRRLMEFIGFRDVKCVEGPSFTCWGYK